MHIKELLFGLITESLQSLHLFI